MDEIKKYSKLLEDLNSALWDLAEIRFQEVQSAKLMTDILREHGFQVECGVAGIPTAYQAVYGQGKPVIGLLAEYDALDGLSQQADSLVPAPRPDTTHGHGCGHHLLGTGVIGAALLLRDYLDGHPDSGTIVVYGCPAEEGGSGKTYMARAGCFDGLDIALTWHPSTINAAMTGSLLANCQAYFRFHGKSSHAGAAPHKGRSALDALELMNVGVNYLREHVEDDVRMHYTYTNTDGPANIVPAYASTNYFIRSAKWERTQDASERVDDCARGAALMTGTRVEIERVTCNREMKLNRTLAEIFYQAMRQIPTPEYTKEELDFAAQISGAAGLDNGGTYFSGLEPLEDEPVRLSIGTDVSDVSHTVPTVMLSAAAMCKGTPLHHWAATAQAGMSIGKKGMLYAAECMALGCVRLVQEPKLLEQVWKEHGGSANL
ncbi:MAG: amidohydrolase [Ruminococcus sp.]|nr:amidohydrolase [Ruminococcus sp.]